VILMADWNLSNPHTMCKMDEDDPSAFGCFHFIRDWDVVKSITSNSRTLSTLGNTPQAWTLSHELSHFVLYYNGEDESVYRYWVHDVQAEVNACAKRVVDSETGEISYRSLESIYDCPRELFRVIYADNMTVPVMRPYYEDRIKFD